MHSKQIKAAPAPHPTHSHGANHPERIASDGKVDGLTVLLCHSDEDREQMTSSWTADKWYEALLDVGIYYEDELREMSVGTVSDLVAYPIGCIVGVAVSYLLWARGLSFYLPFAGKQGQDTSMLVWLCMTIASCASGPNVALLGFEKEVRFTSGLFAAIYPSVLYASSALYTVPIAYAVAWVATAVTTSRVLTLAYHALTREHEDPLPTIVYGSRTMLRELALALLITMLLSITCVVPAGRAAVQAVDASSEKLIARMAGSDTPISEQDLQDVLDQLQVAVCVEAREMGVSPADAPRVYATLIPNERVCAAYRPLDNVILINTLGLSGGWWPTTRASLLYATLHEAYHYRQLMYVSGRAPYDEDPNDLDADTVGRWAKEMRWYPVLSAIPSHYHGLEIERAANRYAGAKLEEYRRAYESQATAKRHRLRTDRATTASVPVPSAYPNRAEHYVG